MAKHLLITAFFLLISGGLQANIDTHGIQCNIVQSEITAMVQVALAGKHASDVDVPKIIERSTLGITETEITKVLTNYSDRAAWYVLQADDQQNKAISLQFGLGLEDGVIFRNFFIKEGLGEGLLKTATILHAARIKNFAVIIDQGMGTVNASGTDITATMRALGMDNKVFIYSGHAKDSPGFVQKAKKYGADGAFSSCQDLDCRKMVEALKMAPGSE
jgi:hypothetical protein